MGAFTKRQLLMRPFYGLFFCLLGFPACLLLAQSSPAVYPYVFQDKWGVVNAERTVILEPSLDTIEQFWEQGLPTANAIARLNGRVGLLSGSGKWIINPRLDSIGYSHYNAANLRWGVKDGQYGLLTTAGNKGKWAVKPRFTEVTEFHGRKLAVAAVRKDNKWGVVNSRGKMVVPCVYDAIKVIDAYSDYPDLKLTQNGVVTYVDAFGARRPTDEMMIAEQEDDQYNDMIFEEMVDRESAWESVVKPRIRQEKGASGETMVILEAVGAGSREEKARVTIDPGFRVEEVKLEDEYSLVGIRYILVSNSGKYGFIGPNGQPCTPVIYDRIDFNGLRYGTAAVLYRGALKGLANGQGERILPAVFSEIKWCRSMVWVTHPAGYEGYADFLGQVFLPLAVDMNEH
ncbi:MAG: hypothetical protein DA408_01730 [Bacteroidetes bacterium]|nr:MAG: hypothetical protein DA408_01730 [Bacteroidota bacterium]